MNKVLVEVVSNYGNVVNHTFKDVLIDFTDNILIIKNRNTHEVVAAFKSWELVKEINE